MNGRTLTDGEFGEIHLRYDTRAVRCIFRVKSGHLQVTLPVGVHPNEVIPVLEKKRGALRRLLAQTPAVGQVAAGKTIATRIFDITINTYHGEKILYSMHGGILNIFLPEKADTTSPQVSEKIKKRIMLFVKQGAAPYLKARLDTVAGRLGLKYKAFSLTSGRRILGKCDSSGNIKLSYYLLFYPEELIDYVICHELAHLSVMNHGEAFHKLCNKYCGGREKELSSRIRRFRQPL